MGERTRMDAADRAELDALRLRAYGPPSDDVLDAASLERLIQLEELALPSSREPEPEPRPQPEPSEIRPAEPSVGPTGAVLPEHAPVHQPPRRRGGLLVVGAIAVGVVAVAALVIGLTTDPTGPTNAAAPTIRAEPSTDPAAPQIDTTAPDTTAPDSVRRALAFATDPLAQVLIQVRTDTPYGGYIADPPAGAVPTFPAGGEVQWAQPLGEYYGFEPWIAGADGATQDGRPQAENCLLVKSASFDRGYCLTATLKEQGALLIAIPFDMIDPAERPPEMTSDQSLGFWWAPDGTLTILLSTPQT